MSCDVKHPARDSSHVNQSIALPILHADGHAATGGRGAMPHSKPHSKMGWKRAVVLGSIQFLMIAHIVQWLWTGSTTSPIEPSESMTAVKDGIINAGTVVFALALLSTVLLGRWFCGWGCHIIMLQDLCGWMLGKVGIRPKPFRSRLLLFVPLLLASYMFLWPLVYRFAIAPYTRPQLSWPGFTTAFVVTDFWATFPGVLISIPFLLVCGFLTVYLLGAKGYCTYACPYGGFFAPLDEFAIGRIRVTDACEQCGHCTSVCTSNVRVHEEVHDFGMVTDQGCMKCMDCVSACPNDALYFGFGRPAAARVQRTVEPAAPRRFDLTWREEIAFAVLAALAFIAVRGTYGVTLPLLFASGTTACVVYVVWKAYRVLRDDNVRLHTFQLRMHGRLRPGGAAFVGGGVLLTLLVMHSAVINAIGFRAAMLDDRVTIPPQVVFADSPLGMDQRMAVHAERALELYGVVSTFGRGGYGIFPPAQRSIDQRRAWLQSALGRYDDAERTLRDGIERDGLNEVSAAGIGRVLRGQRRRDDAEQWYEATTAAHPTWLALHDEYVQWLSDDERSDDAIAVSRRGLERNPDDLFLMRRLSLLLVEDGVGDQIDEGIRLTERTLEIAPDNPFAYRALAIGHARRERMDEAEVALRRAMELAPTDWRLRQSLGELLIGIGKDEEGAVLLKDATMQREREARR